MNAALIAGFALSLSLILAIGAQNAFVLRQGLRRAHVGAVVAVCCLSEAVLIFTGVAGFGAIAARAPWAIEAMRWGGAAFLVVYGLRSLRAAWTTTGALEAGGPAGAKPAHCHRHDPAADMGQPACLSRHGRADRRGRGHLWRGALGLWRGRAVGLGPVLRGLGLWRARRLPLSLPGLPRGGRWTPWWARRCWRWRSSLRLARERLDSPCRLRHV
jgi:hypothetical protein